MSKEAERNGAQSSLSLSAFKSVTFVWDWGLGVGDWRLGSMVHRFRVELLDF